MKSDRWAVLLATCGGIGFAPVGPGTVGSLAAAGLAYLFVWAAGVSPIWLLLPTALALGPAIWSAGAAARRLEMEDPSAIVIDEAVGQWVALCPAATTDWGHWVAAFVLFRIFDIAKPFPLRRLERLPGGMGIVADDLGAGLCAMIMLASFRWLNG